MQHDQLRQRCRVPPPTFVVATAGAADVLLQLLMGKRDAAAAPAVVCATSG